MIEVGDMIKDPEDESLGIVIEDHQESERYSIYWFAKYSGITKEHYRDFSGEPIFGGFCKIA